jgi:ribosomal protein L30/L7E
MAVSNEEKARAAGFKAGVKGFYTPGVEVGGRDFHVPEPKEGLVVFHTLPQPPRIDYPQPPHVHDTLANQKANIIRLDGVIRKHFELAYLELLRLRKIRDPQVYELSAKLYDGHVQAIKILIEGFKLAIEEMFAYVDAVNRSRLLG